MGRSAAGRRAETADCAAMANVRPATETDLPVIAAVYAHWVEHSVVTFDLEAPDVDEWGRRRDAAVTGGHPWMVTELDGRVAGYATASPFRPKPAYRSTVETTIYLDVAHVGRGLGRPLYEALLEEAANAVVPPRGGGNHAAQPGIGRAPRGAWVRVGRGLRAGRPQARRVAGRRVVAAAACAGGRVRARQPG